MCLFLLYLLLFLLFSSLLVLVVPGNLIVLRRGYHNAWNARQPNTHLGIAIELCMSLLDIKYVHSLSINGP
jgi:hypothetical protein